MRHGFAFQTRVYESTPHVEAPAGVRVKMEHETKDGIVATVISAVGRKPFGVRKEVNGTIRFIPHSPKNGHTPDRFLAEDAVVSEKVGSTLTVRLASSANHQPNIMCRVCGEQYGRFVHPKKLCMCPDCTEATVGCTKRDQWDDRHVGETHAVRNEGYLAYLQVLVGVMV